MTTGKPLGIEMFPGDGRIFGVTPICKLSDNIWDAVRDAQAKGWTPKQFMNEVQQAWGEAMDEDKKGAMEEFKR